MFSLSKALERVGGVLPRNGRQQAGVVRTSFGKCASDVASVVATMKSQGFDPTAKSSYFDRAITEMNKGTLAGYHAAMDSLTRAEQDHEKIKDATTRKNLCAATQHMMAVCEQRLKK